MDIQSVVVAIVVFACAASAGWMLMPATWRRRVAIASLALPLPHALAAWMRARAERASGCACDGCHQGTARRQAEAQPTNVRPITLHRQLPR